jgi:Homeodomain-like domain
MTVHKDSVVKIDPDVPYRRDHGLCGADRLRVGHECRRGATRGNRGDHCVIRNRRHELLAHLSVRMEKRMRAVRIVRETGRPIAEIARQLGINAGTLDNWVAKDRAEREGAQGLSTKGWPS